MCPVPAGQRRCEGTLRVTVKRVAGESRASHMAAREWLLTVMSPVRDWLANWLTVTGQLLYGHWQVPSQLYS